MNKLLLLLALFSVTQVAVAAETGESNAVGGEALNCGFGIRKTLKSEGQPSSVVDHQAGSSQSAQSPAKKG